MRLVIDEKRPFPVSASVADQAPTARAAPPHEPRDACTQLIIDGPFAETKEILVG